MASLGYNVGYIIMYFKYMFIKSALRTTVKKRDFMDDDNENSIPEHKVMKYLFGEPVVD